MDIPFGALKYLWVKPDKVKYEPYGVVVSKPWAYEHGARPVLYLSDDELERLCIPTDERWRVGEVVRCGNRPI